MPTNPFSPFVDPWQFVCSFRHVPIECDKRYIAAAKEADDFQQRELTPEARKLLIKHADDKYAERVKELEQLDRKREWLVTFSMGAVTFLVGAQRFAGHPLVGPIKFFFSATVLSFLLAVGTLLLSRRVVHSPSRFNIQHMREGLAHEGISEPEDWMAASLHKTCEAYRVHQDAIAAHINFAMSLIFVALFCLAIIAVFS